MSIKTLAKGLRTPGTSGHNVIEHIFTDAGLRGQEAAYIEKYFDEDLRKIIWKGTRVVGSLFVLSDAAVNLKTAFQSRFFANGQFKPSTAFHATKSAAITNSIAVGGFRPAGETLVGNGTYFFNAFAPARQYAEAAHGQVIEVTIFSTISVGNPTALGSDTVTLQTSHNTLVVKNALVIFPKVVHQT